MYSSEDLERFYFQYQTEAMPKGISIEQFCSRNKGKHSIASVDISMKSNTFALQNIKQRIWQAVKILK